MKAETRILLAKELEKLKSINERNIFIGTIMELIFSIVWLASTHISIAMDKSSDYYFWIPLNFVPALVILLHSFYKIIRHFINKKFSILFEAVLEIKDSTESSSDKMDETVNN